MNGTVAIGNPSSVSGNVISSVGNIDCGGPCGDIVGSATAAGTIAAGLTPSSLSQSTSSAAPPRVAFPQIPWVAANWTTPPDGSTGYTVQSFTDCSTAKAWLETPANISGATNIVIRIGAVCNLEFRNSYNYSFGGNLAIVTDGSVSMKNNVTFSKTGARGKLFFIDAYRSGLNCASGD